MGLLVTEPYILDETSVFSMYIYEYMLYSYVYIMYLFLVCIYMYIFFFNFLIKPEYCLCTRNQNID